MRAASFLYGMLSVPLALAQSEVEIAIIVGDPTPTGFSVLGPGVAAIALLAGAVYFLKFRK